MISLIVPGAEGEKASIPCQKRKGNEGSEGNRPSRFSLRTERRGEKVMPSSLLHRREEIKTGKRNSNSSYFLLEKEKREKRGPSFLNSRRQGGRMRQRGIAYYSVHGKKEEKG